MSLTNSDYIHYLINEAKRKLIPINNDFLEQLHEFIDSDIGKEGFEKFSKLNPYRVGIRNTDAKSFKSIFKRMGL